jgi:2-phospho-L-lactate/phosphoenolpyruvate guanylyltransferase
MQVRCWHGGGFWMSIWAIVPIKPLRRGKSRLSGVLTQDERTVLNQYLLSHTLDTLKSVPELEQVLVVSRDPAALSLARAHGARTVLESGAPHLNVALARATIVARNYAARGVLIVPADLPLITPQDVRYMLESAKEPPVVAIAPDRRGTGTNALLVSPVGLIQYDFGEGSFQRHCEHTRQAEARLEVCDLASLALDVDYPEDLALVSDELEGLYEELERIAAFPQYL